MNHNKLHFFPGLDIIVSDISGTHLRAKIQAKRPAQDSGISPHRKPPLPAGLGPISPDSGRETMRKQTARPPDEAGCEFHGN